MSWPFVGRGSPASSSSGSGGGSSSSNSSRSTGGGGRWFQRRAMARGRTLLSILGALCLRGVPGSPRSSHWSSACRGRLPPPPPAPPRKCGANTLPPGSRAPPSNSKRTTTPRGFYWTEKTAGVGVREGKCPGSGAEDGALPGPPTCRLLPTPLGGRILPEALGKLPLDTRHLGRPNIYPKKHPFSQPHGTTTTNEILRQNLNKPTQGHF